MSKVCGLVAVAALACLSPAAAGMQSWSTDVERDPFTRGENVNAGYIESFRSGALIICNTSGRGIEVRALSGWQITTQQVASIRTSLMDLAVDGEVVLMNLNGRVGACGPSIACVSSDLDPEDAKTFLGTLIVATKQVAIRDGISSAPLLLSARGSTKIGERLLACLAKQNK